MTDLRTAAQTVIDEYSKHGLMMVGYDSGQIALAKLRQALAAPVEHVAVVFEEFDSQVHYIETIDNKLRLPVGTKLYTTPPSVDALIAEAIEKHDEKNALIKTVNMRTQAQPYLDALIADLMELHLTWEDYQDVKEVCDKYRGVK